MTQHEKDHVDQLIEQYYAQYIITIKSKLRGNDNDCMSILHRAYIQYMDPFHRDELKFDHGHTTQLVLFDEYLNKLCQHIKDQRAYQENKDRRA